MANPILPGWEYIPDGEPRVFGDRIYLYGSHDSAGSDKFCDYKLKVWSASIHDLNHWQCHGDSFHTRPDRDHPSDTPWTQEDLFAPDVVEQNGRYYLYAYIMGAKGCVAVSDRPEGPFQLVSPYQYTVPAGKTEDCFDRGSLIDPGVLVDDDGRVYIYCGYQGSYMAELNPENMYEILDGTYQKDIIPKEEPFSFFEACSPRKIGDTYYLIYSPNKGSRLVYATSDSPTGPFTWRGILVDNEVNYPGGNNHGSICKIGDQWYVFYHRMTNGTIMSRRSCVEKIQLLPDGSIPQVEMTSLGFADSLSPYEITPADLACHLTGGCLITEHNVFTRVVTGITDGCVMGYKYFDFGEDFSSKTLEFSAQVRGTGCKANLLIRLDAPDGKLLGSCPIGMDDSTVSCVVDCPTGRHAIFLQAEAAFGGYFQSMFQGRQLFELVSFVFMK